MPCPHDNIVHCPLYVAAHDADLVGLSCFTGKEDVDGCRFKHLDHTAMVERLRARAPRLVAECEFKAEADRIRGQRRRNMRAAGLSH